MLKKLFSNDYLLNVFNKLYTIVMGLLTSIFLTRYLGVFYRGEYSYVLEITLVLSIILGLGITQTYSYFFRKFEGDFYSKIIGFYLQQFILYSLISFVIIGIFHEEPIIVMTSLLVPTTILNSQLSSAIAVENIRDGIKIQIIIKTLRMIIFLIAWLLFDSGLFIPVLLTVFLNVINICLILYSVKMKADIFTFDNKFIKMVIKFSWIPMVTSLFITLNYSVDIILLKHLGKSLDLGLYSTAVGIINYVWLIPDAFKEVLLSRVARVTNIRNILLTLKLSVATVIGIVILLILFGRVGIIIMYGHEFLNSYGVAIVLSIGAISMVYFKIIGVVLMAEGKRWFYFITLLVSIIMNIIFNIIFIPSHGMYGAAWASVLSYMICGLVFLIYFLRDKDIQIKDILLISIDDIKMVVKSFERR